MQLARVMDKPEDYKKLGINPNTVELWEDGRRDKPVANHFEWWYFDAILDDGTSVVIQFLPKTSVHLKKNGDFPIIRFNVTLSDGTKYVAEPSFKAKDTSYAEDRCDVRYGANFFRGDLKEYSIHVEPVGGLAADLHLTNLASPYRPGTAYFEFGPENYYTWLCVVPRGEVTGTLTINGQTKQVHGMGYHDHQWGSLIYHKLYNNWVWARQSFGDYTLLIFDMICRKEYNKERFPIVFLQDKEGKIVFESTHNVSCQVLEEYHDNEASDKDYPKAIHYVFENGGKQIEYTLRMKKIIENVGPKTMPFIKRIALWLMKLRFSYARYIGQGDMIFSDGKQEIKRSGELIYEFMYGGETFQEYMNSNS